jgi:osmotically-inducible protein OsmY
MRHRSREAVRRGKYLEGVAAGLAHRAVHVSINAERGVVYLRGRLDSTEQIDALVRATGGVDGVKGVKSLLHT